MIERAEQVYQALMDLGLSENEINSQINEKLTEYQGFMTKEGALYLIGKEKGIDVYSSDPNIQKEIEELIDYNDFAILIADVIEEMQNIVIAGRITDIFGINNFTKKDGTSGIVGSFQICDLSSCIKIVLWNKQVKDMENKYFKKGEIVQVIGGYSKKGIADNLEIHLSRQGKLVLAPEDVTLPKIKKNENLNVHEEKFGKKSSKFTIEELHMKEGFIRFVKGIVQIDKFKELTLKNGEKSFLLKLILSDDTASIKVNIWGMKAVEAIKIINDGDGVRLTNVVIKENSYSNEKELNFTKNSRLELILGS
ncbi:MAG: hypothetical protein KAW51_07425 [Candidatus Lokiarchaeota archaeon]|nr:hypothetical protein [Candidatus Lokiarchaeota archaeon]